MKMLNNNLFDLAYECILENEPELKVSSVNVLFNCLVDGELNLDQGRSVEQIIVPGRPDKPELVTPSDVPRRGFNSEIARIKLAHAIAHIEFNAINLALDAVYRFQDMPHQYYLDWMQVAVEESRHFVLLDNYLKANGSHYGAYDAHNGLWEMAIRTEQNVMIRMALVPRVLEARGLDVTPGMIERLKVVGDDALVSILEVIHEEEIGHVRIGTHWFNFSCEQQGVKPELSFSAILDEYMKDSTFGPFDLISRQQAGFTKQEMQDLMSRSHTQC